MEKEVSETPSVFYIAVISQDSEFLRELRDKILQDPSNKGKSFQVREVQQIKS